MADINGKQIAANIYTKAKEEKVKIGDIEKNLGVALGYFSRFLKDDNTSLPSLDAVTTAAQMLGVTIDSLMHGRYYEMSDTEKYIYDRVNLLLTNTLSNKLEWTEIRVKDFLINDLSWDRENDRYVTTYPMASYETYMTYSEEHANQIYYSLYLEKKVTLQDSIFKLSLFSNDFYIARIFDENVMYYELYSETKEQYSVLSKIINANSNDKVFYKLLDDLYMACKEQSKVLKLSSDAKKALDEISLFIDGTDLPF